MTKTSLVTTLGTGPGGLAIAADLAAAGRDVVVSDLPPFSDRIASIEERGGIEVQAPWRGSQVVPVRSIPDIGEAIRRAQLVIVSVPASVHEVFIQTLLPHLASTAALLFMGEGSGSMVARRDLPSATRGRLLLGETNCLPFIARSAGPATITVDRKQGGVLLAAIPATRTEELLRLIGDVWPCIEPARSVLETALINYDAIDTVPTALTNVGVLEARSGGTLLWGEGATPSVVRLIGAVDAELLAIRNELGFSDRRTYRDLLIAQGLAPDVGDLFEGMRAGGITRSVRASGTTSDLQQRLDLEVPYSLVLAASVGDAAGVDTPVIDGLIALAEAMVGPAMRSSGRTLTSLGLGGMSPDQLRSHLEDP